MLFFVMYDISNDKVRNQLAKYLLGKGCYRVQKSVFLSDASTDTYSLICRELEQIQQFCEDIVQILIVPINRKSISELKVYGQSLDLGLIMKTQSTLFF